MTIGELLADLRTRDIRIWLEGEKLRCSAPPGALDAETKSLVAERRQEIIDALRQADRPVGIVPLKPTGSRPPIFAIPGHNGDVFCFLPLARRLAAHQPLMGVQRPGVVTGDPIEDLNALAAHHVEQISRYYPNGPYLIAGYCAGGTIAFEVARQLESRGLPVAMVALLGSPYPETFRRSARPRLTVKAVVSGVRRHARALIPLSLSEGVQYVQSRIERRFGRPASSGPELSADDVRRRRVEDATMVAVRQYNVGTIHAGIDLFIPSRDWRPFGGPPYQWRSVARFVREHPSPSAATLDTMLHEPFVESLANDLDALIGETLERTAVVQGALAG